MQGWQHLSSAGVMQVQDCDDAGACRTKQRASSGSWKLGQRSKLGHVHKLMKNGENSSVSESWKG